VLAATINGAPGLHVTLKHGLPAPREADVDSADAQPHFPHHPVGRQTPSR
jgi:hypothetical protein